LTQAGRAAKRSKKDHADGSAVEEENCEPCTCEDKNLEAVTASKKRGKKASDSIKSASGKLLSSRSSMEQNTAECCKSMHVQTADVANKKLQMARQWTTTVKCLDSRKQ